MQEIPHPEQLLGCWHLMSQAPDADGVEMEFRPGGELIYAIQASDRWQVARLSWRVEGSEIVTDQPSSPHEERTRFFIDERGLLHLHYGETATTYVRGPKQAPAV